MAQRLSDSRSFSAEASLCRVAGYSNFFLRRLHPWWRIASLTVVVFLLRLSSAKWPAPHCSSCVAKALCQRAFATPGLQPWCRKGSLTENLCDTRAAGLQPRCGQGPLTKGLCHTGAAALIFSGQVGSSSFSAQRATVPGWSLQKYCFFRLLP